MDPQELQFGSIEDEQGPFLGPENDVLAFRVHHAAFRKPFIMEQLDPSLRIRIAGVKSTLMSEGQVGSIL